MLFLEFSVAGGFRKQKILYRIRKCMGSVSSKAGLLTRQGKLHVCYNSGTFPSSLPVLPLRKEVFANHVLSLACLLDSKQIDLHCVMNREVEPHMLRF